jgi:hypothetical protein
MLNFFIRVVCLLTASLMATHAMSQDMSGWSDKTVCRLLLSKQDEPAYLEEVASRGLGCGSAQKNVSKPLLPFKYIQGVSEDQWDLIERMGDPQNCRERVRSIGIKGKSITVTPDTFPTTKWLMEKMFLNYDTVIFSKGIYKIVSPIPVFAGSLMIGEEGVVIDSTLSDVGIIVDGSVVSNVEVINAGNIGVQLSSNSVLHNSKIGNTGVLNPTSRDGSGVRLRTKGSHNVCIVSVESYNGYNETGSGPDTSKGGNADGFGVKYGVYNVTLIDAHGHHNSDDGFDFWKAGTGMDIENTDISFRIYYSSSIGNGRHPTKSSGDGSGFKFGSSNNYGKPKKDRGLRLIHGSAACHNAGNGFDRNTSPLKVKGSNLHTSGNKNKSFVSVNNSFSTKDPFRLRCSMFPSR